MTRLIECRVKDNTLCLESIAKLNHFNVHSSVRKENAGLWDEMLVKVTDNLVQGPSN